MSRIRVTIVVEKQSVRYSVCVCNVSYPACKAHAPYYVVICGLSGSTIFSHIINDTIFEGGKRKVIEHEVCVLIFSTTLYETFLIIRRIQRDIVISVHRSSCKLPFILVIF